MEELKSNRAMTLTPMSNVAGEAGSRKLSIQSELEGHICLHCGSRRYSLVFRMVRGRPGGRLAARCSHCRGYRAFTPDHIVSQGNDADTLRHQEGMS